MARSLDSLNHKSTAFVAAALNDRASPARYHWRMKKPHHDWHLAEWAATLGKRQSDIVRDLDWNKARVSLLFANKQQYNRDTVNDLATYLQIAPHELLMHPADAMAIRRLKQAVAAIAAETSASDDNASTPKKVSFS